MDILLAFHNAALGLNPDGTPLVIDVTPVKRHKNVTGANGKSNGKDKNGRR